MVQLPKSRIARGVRTTSAHLRSILTTNLATQRQEAERHAEELKKKKAEAEEYARKLASMKKQALEGARNLVAIYNSQEMQEMLRVMAQVRGHNHELVLHESEANYGGEFLAWRWTRCQISMTIHTVKLSVQQVGQREPGESEFIADLVNPCYYDAGGEVERPLEKEIEFVELLYTDTA